MAGFQYFWTCPSCGTELELRKRVTQTKRRCPHCGDPVTFQEIDRQGVERGHQEAKRQFDQTTGCLWAFLALLFLIAICQVVGNK